MATTPLARKFRRAAASIAVVGLLAAAVIATVAHRDEELPEFGAGSIAAAREEQQLERLGGKSALLLLRFQQWFESLWHGERLAWTTGALSLLIAALCLHLAALAEEDDQ